MRAKWGSSRLASRRAFSLFDLLVLVVVLLILAALLLPALAAAREKARRTACMSQLMQMASGLQSYCTDYMQYFPSHPAYGSSFRRGSAMKDGAWTRGATVWHDDGYCVNRRAPKQVVRTNATRTPDDKELYVYDAPACRFRTIFAGDKCKSDLHDADHRTPVKGELNMGPLGLGRLLAGGYVADARLLYCPSVQGRMPAPSGRWVNEVKAGKSIEDLKKVGGFEANSVMYGDWSFVGEWESRYFKGRALVCDYAYRNMPLVTSWNNVKQDRVHIRKTKPRMRAEVGCPPFKTQKLLGGRAIVADAFGRNFTELNYKEAQKNPGMGHYAHKDRYNVLYGDWSISWYGDVKEKLMYWPYPAIAEEKGVNELFSAACTASSGLYWYTKLDETTEEWGDIKESSQGVWNLLDKHHGMDL